MYNPTHHSNTPITLHLEKHMSPEEYKSEIHFESIWVQTMPQTLKHFEACYCIFSPFLYSIPGDVC